MAATSHSSSQRSLSQEICSLRYCSGSAGCGRAPCRHDGPQFGSTQTAPHERYVARVSKCAPTTRDLRCMTVQSPNQPNKPRRSPCNVPTRSQMDFDSRDCYRFRPEGDAIRGISVKSPSTAESATVFGQWEAVSGKSRLDLRHCLCHSLTNQKKELAGEETSLWLRVG